MTVSPTGSAMHEHNLDEDTRTRSRSARHTHKKRNKKRELNHNKKQGLKRSMQGLGQWDYRVFEP